MSDDDLIARGKATAEHYAAQRAQRNGQPDDDWPPPDEAPPPEPGEPPDEPPDDDGPPKLATLLLTRTALKTLPDPQPLIGNVLDQGTVALLYGKWGTGKSFIALDWAISVAAGRNWQGRSTQQRRTLYVAAEGAYGLKARVDAWEQGWHTPIGDEDIQILPQPINLTNAAHIRELIALLDYSGYGFVIIDTLARCMVGADENSAQDCGEVVDTLAMLRDHTPDHRGVILGVHHTGKDGKTFRGSSVFEAGADTVYAVAKDGGAIILEREKRRDGPQADHHELQLDPVTDTSSAVVCVHRGVDKLDRADRLLSTFVHHFMSTGATKAELRGVADMPSATFHRALSDLVQRRELINTGTDKRPFYKLSS